MSEIEPLPAATLAAREDPSDVLDSTAAGGRILRGGVVRFGGYVLTVALSVLSAALLTRHLGVARFGQYTTVLSLVGVVSAVTDAGMSTVGTREFSVRDGSERDELMRDLLGLRMLLTAVGVLLVAAFAVAAGYDTALLLGAILAGLGTIALVVQHTHTIPISAALRIGTLSLLELLRQVLSVAAIVALVLVGGGVLPLLAVALVVNLMLIPPTALLARHQITLRMAFRPSRWLDLLRLTVSFSLAAAVGTIYVYTAQILTSLVASQHQSGLFAASFRVFIVLSAVPGLLVGGALPLLARAARDDRDRLAYSLHRIFEVSLILGVLTAIGTLGGASFIVEVIAGQKFAGAASVLQIQGLALVASFVVAGWSFALLSLQLYKGVLLVNLASFLVSCGLTAVLASSDGAKGAAIATLCGEGVLAIGSLLALVHGRRELRPKLGVALKVSTAAAPAVLVALLPDLPSVVRALLAVVVYTVLVLLLRAVPAEMLELLPARFRGEGPPLVG
ncbi:MAG TPA: oligosaccharide flippase family protein [Solirubrobacteraceae bacterium]|nr:oligosaccharide flippase family protein [Solirubrobacteraceae bacterium]